MLAALLFLAVFAAFAAVVIIDVRARRAAADRPDAEEELALIEPGRRVALEAGEHAVSVMAPRAGVARILRRDRLVAATVAGVLVVGVGVLVRLHQVGYLTAPPRDRDVVVAELDGTGWNPLVFADYSPGQELLVYRAGAGVQPTATITLNRESAPDGGTTLDGLPTGWLGRIDTRSGLTTIRVWRADGGRLAEISADSTAAGADIPTATLQAWLATLAGTVERTGIAALARETAQPSHG